VRTYALNGAAVAALPAVTAPARNLPRQRASARRRAPRLSIVGLPFANLSNDPEQEHFADGITAI
jgi:adenylate cyclase